MTETIEVISCSTSSLKMCKSKEITPCSGRQKYGVFSLHFLLPGVVVQGFHNNGSIEIVLNLTLEVPFECVKIDSITKLIRYQINDEGQFTTLDLIIFSCLDEDKTTIGTFVDTGMDINLYQFGWTEEFSLQYQNDGVCNVYFTSR